TLEAHSNIAINAPITATSGGLTLSAGSDITATAAINVGTFTLQSGTWTQVGPSLPAFAANDFRIAGGTFIRALGGDGDVDSPYQITDVYGLQGVGSSGMLDKAFVLANNIDATGTANWNSGEGFKPIGDQEIRFYGNFDGQNYAINGLTIASAAHDIGLFGV